MPLQTSGVAVMNLQQMQDYVNQVMVPRGGAAVFRGPPGIGKTRSMVANALLQQSLDADFGGCLFNMANAESIDVRGLPQVSALVSSYGLPPWLCPVPAEGLRGAYPALCPQNLRGEPSTWSLDLALSYETADVQLASRCLKPYSRGIIILDECLQTIEESVLLSLAQMFDEHRIGEWGVPRLGWAIVGLTNRINDQAGVRELYAHVRNRIAMVDTEHDPDGTDKHWLSVGMNDMFRHFARFQPNSIFIEAVPNTQEQFTTPRSFHYAHDDVMAWLQNVDGISAGDLRTYKIPHDHVMTRVMVASRCGVSTAALFSDFLLNMRERPSFKSIIANPAAAKLPTHSAVVRAIIEMCVDRVDVQTLKKVCAYIGRPEMPSTMKAIFCQQLARRMAVTTLYAHNDFLRLVDSTGPAARQLLFGKENEV